MGYKLKPNKGAAKRMRVTKTGKLKHNHTKTSHLRSARSSKLKRKLRRPSVLHEGLARNIRRLMGVSALKPRKVAHERALEAKTGDE
jgi:large subunit ribosomal protein L35